MKTSHLFLRVLTGGVLLFSGCVSSERYTSLENRVMSLELDNNRRVSAISQQHKKDEQNSQRILASIEKMTKDIENNENSINEKYAETMAQLQEQKAELQRLKGLIEEAKYSLQSTGTPDGGKADKTFERLDAAISKNYERLVALEKYMGFEPTAATGEPKTDEPAPGTPEQDTTESELYAHAKKLLDDGDRENARIQFENFINRFPESQNADNARFWIADSYYADKWYEKAILEYQKVLEQYPGSNKITAALLKQGYAFAELGEKANARLILKELIKKSPDSKEAKYASEKLKTLN